MELSCVRPGKSFFSDDETNSSSDGCNLRHAELWRRLQVGRFDLTVFAAASLTDSLIWRLGPITRRKLGQKVVFNFEASSLLARQIEEGAPADIFFSADEAQMNALANGKGFD